MVTIAARNYFFPVKSIHLSPHSEQGSMLWVRWWSCKDVVVLSPRNESLKLPMCPEGTFRRYSFIESHM